MYISPLFLRGLMLAEACLRRRFWWVFVKVCRRNAKLKPVDPSSRSVGVACPVVGRQRGVLRRTPIRRKAKQLVKKQVGEPVRPMGGLAWTA